MAAKKSTTKAVKMSIPANMRKRVAKVRQLLMIADGKHVTSEQAYKNILNQRKFTAAKAKEAAAELAKHKKEDKRRRREQAIEKLQRGIKHLADTRDLLKQMENGENNYFAAEAQATFARATLSDAAAEMEQALLDLGLLDRAQGKFGWFVPDLPDSPEAREASHG